MRILVEKNKYNTLYYDVSTNELLAATALKILTQRFNDNWYYKPSLNDFYYGHEKETFLSEEEIEDLPEHLQAAERDKVRRLKACKVKLIQAEYECEEIERIVKEQDNSFEEVQKMDRKYINIPAWSALQSRCDYEYENVYIEKPINVLEN